MQAVQAIRNSSRSGQNSIRQTWWRQWSDWLWRKYVVIPLNQAPWKSRIIGRCPINHHVDYFSLFFSFGLHCNINLRPDPHRCTCSICTPSAHPFVAFHSLWFTPCPYEQNGSFALFIHTPAFFISSHAHFLRQRSVHNAFWHFYWVASTLISHVSAGARQTQHYYRNV